MCIPTDKADLAAILKARWPQAWIHRPLPTPVIPLNPPITLRIVTSLSGKQFNVGKPDYTLLDKLYPPAIVRDVDSTLKKE